MKRNSFALLAPLLAFNEFEVQLYSWSYIWSLNLFKYSFYVIKVHY
jgi:hypothetical protein